MYKGEATLFSVIHRLNASTLNNIINEAVVFGLLAGEEIIPLGIANDVF